MANPATATTMRAWRVRRPGPMDTRPLEQVTTDVPHPEPSELLVAVRACGVCRTDLHVTDGELARRLGAVTIGYRSLLRAELPTGGRLGIYGFGGSAHITAQVALAQGAEVHVMTRGAEARELALKLGVASAQGAADPPPVPLDAAILFAPVGDLVLPALEALDRGGTLSVAGIHLSDIPSLNY